MTARAERIVLHLPARSATIGTVPGQTLAQIRSLLASAGLSPRKRFGQNFLIDLNLMRKLLAAAEVTPADTVLEVGAGTGSLTEMLLETGACVVAVEVDRGLHALLADRLADHPKLRLIAADVLAGKHQINPLVCEALAATAPQPGGHRKLVANLPYQVATPLLLELLFVRPPVQRMCVTVQKEVGERLLAASRSAAYGPVSVLVQSLAQVRTIATLPPQVFWPAPQVESLMLCIEPLPPERLDLDDPPGFARFVREFFRQRRKMLRRLLREPGDRPALAALAQAGISPQARPEELTPADWRRMFRLIGERNAARP